MCALWRGWRLLRRSVRAVLACPLASTAICRKNRCAMVDRHPMGLTGVRHRRAGPPLCVRGSRASGRPVQDDQHNRVPPYRVRYGAHAWLGQHLARLEMRILFEELIPWLDTLELAGEPKRSASSWGGGSRRSRCDLYSASLACGGSDIAIKATTNALQNLFETERQWRTNIFKLGPDRK